MSKQMVSEDRRKVVFNFSQAINAVIPIARPEVIADAFKRLTVEPTPVGIFEKGMIPASLRELWFQARISRERYFEALAQEVLLYLPATEGQQEQTNHGEAA